MWQRSSRSGAAGGNCVEVAWRRSSRSSASGGQCVEVAEWRKASRSTDTGACVEVAETQEFRLLRDSKDPDGPWLTFPVAAFEAFVGTIKGGLLRG